MIEIRSRGTGDVRDDGVEDLTVVLVRIEAEIEKVAEESTALRGPERVCVLHRRDRAVGDVLEPCCGVPHSHESETGDGRVRSGVRKLVGTTRLESALEGHGI